MLIGCKNCKWSRIRKTMTHCDVYCNSYTCHFYPRREKTTGENFCSKFETKKRVEKDI